MYSNNNKLTQALREKANALRDWLYSHTSPNISADEFCKVANDYAILCAKIYITEKTSIAH